MRMLLLVKERGDILHLVGLYIEWLLVINKVCHPHQPIGLTALCQTLPGSDIRTELLLTEDGVHRCQHKRLITFKQR